MSGVDSTKKIWTPDDLHLVLRMSMTTPESRSLVVDSPCPKPKEATRTCEEEPIAWDGDEGNVLEGEVVGLP